VVVGLLATAFGAGVAGPAAAQPACRWLCTPDLKVEPTITIEHLFGAARIEELEDGQVVATTTQPREAVFELILAVGCRPRSRA